MTANRHVASDDGPHIAALAQKLLHGDFSDLSDREQRVIAAIARRQIASRDVNQAIEEVSGFGQRLADDIAKFGGSWAFIIGFVIGLAGWIGVNLIIYHQYGTTFDPYPFIFLNLVLSMVAALQAPFILMSQNRQANRDRVAAGLDYEINLKSELEVMALREKLDMLPIGHVLQILEDQQVVLSQITLAFGATKPTG